MQCAGMLLLLCHVVNQQLSPLLYLDINFMELGERLTCVKVYTLGLDSDMPVVDWHVIIVVSRGWIGKYVSFVLRYNLHEARGTFDWRVGLYFRAGLGLFMIGFIHVMVNQLVSPRRSEKGTWQSQGTVWLAGTSGLFCDYSWLLCN